MLRKLVAVSIAAIVAAGLAVTSAMASEEPPRIAVSKRGPSVQPPLGPTTPTTSRPEVLPPDKPSIPRDDRDFGPGPDLSGPPPAAPPPTPPPLPSPPPVSPGPTLPSHPADDVGPDETVRLPAGRPEDAPVRLPQTGSGTRPLTATGGASLLAAGLAVIAGARQRSRISQPVRRR